MPVPVPPGRLMPGAEPYAHDGGTVAVLLCHGFTGSPQALRPWGEQLAEAGFTVRVPRLPGHGTSWQQLNRTRWPDWYARVDEELRALRGSGHAVVVAGLSMGGALALRLAQEHGPDVAGVVLVNPAVRLTDRRLRAVPLLRHVVSSAAGVASDIHRPGVTEVAYPRVPLHALHSMLAMTRVVARDLPSVDQPILLLRSLTDHVVPASSSALVISRVSSTDVTEVLLPHSYHVATLDEDAATILEHSVAFARRVGAAAAPAGRP